MASTEPPVPGWIEGKSVEIGASLPKLDWRKRGVFRDNTDARNLPPVIDGHDYLQPNPFIHDPITVASMVVARDDSKAPEYMAELARQGIGVNPKTGVTVAQWADKLARQWYGKPYADLHRTGGPDPAGDFDKRAQIRAAMATKSWSAWLAMTSAQQQDIAHLSGIGAKVGTVASSAAGAVSVVLLKINPIAGAIAAAVSLVIGLVNMILGLAAADTQKKLIENIQASPLRLMETDAVTMCAIATSALNQQYAFARGASAPSAAQQALNVATAKLLGEIERMDPETRLRVYARCEAVRRDPILGALFPATAPPVVEDIIVQSNRVQDAGGPLGVGAWLGGIPVLGPAVQSVINAIPPQARGPVAVLGGAGLVAALVAWLTRPRPSAGR